MDQVNREAVERVRQDPHEARAVLEEYRDKIDRARSEYNEAAAAYEESYKQELSDHRKRLADIKSDRSKMMPVYLKGMKQRPLARLAEKEKPGTIKEHEGYLATLKTGLDELTRIEKETLACKFLGDAALWGRLLSKEQALYEIEEEARLTRLAIADIVGDEADGLKKLLNDTVWGLRQSVTVEERLEFYNLEDKHDQTVRQLIHR